MHYRGLVHGRGRTLGVGLAVVASLPVAAAAAHHQPGHQGGRDSANKISIDAKSPVVWARSTVVTGKVTGSGNSGVAVELEADPFPFEDNGFTQVATGATDAGGDYRFRAKPTSHTRYRVVARTSPPVTSAADTVLVRLRVSTRVSDSTPRAGSLVRFAGTVCPEHDGKLAYIQRRTSSGSYRTVARARLADAGDRCSKYARRVRARSDGVYRVKVPSRDLDHSTGVGRRIRLNAH